jgi:hypothetical protein
MDEYPAICDECGLDTTPGRRGEIEDGTWDWYVVHDHVWAAAGMPVDPDREPPCAGEGFLHVLCLEKRLGRELTADDFPADVPLNTMPFSTQSEVLLERLRPLHENALAEEQMRKDLAA